MSDDDLNFTITIHANVRNGFTQDDLFDEIRKMNLRTAEIQDSTVQSDALDLDAIDERQGPR